MARAAAAADVVVVMAGRGWVAKEGVVMAVARGAGDWGAKG